MLSGNLLQARIGITAFYSLLDVDENQVVQVNAAEVIANNSNLSPATPLSPLLFRYGISFVSGARITDEDVAIATIQQGATLPQVNGVRLVTMTRAMVVAT